MYLVPGNWPKYLVLISVWKKADSFISSEKLVDGPRAIMIPLYNSNLEKLLEMSVLPKCKTQN